MKQKHLFNQLIILTGHRKSGTSAFHRLFDNHPSIYVYPVDISVLYAYFPFFTERYGDNPYALRKRLKLVLKKSMDNIASILETHHFFKVDLFVEMVCNELQDSDLTKKDKIIKVIANTWIKLFYKTSDPKPFLFKETSQSVFLEDFIAFNLPVKMISLIRDPRDNYAAIKAGVKKYYSQMNENELESLASVINRARMDLLSAQLNKNNFPNNFMSVRFEDLVANTDMIMREITEFLGISYNEVLLSPTRFGAGYEGNSHEGKRFAGLSNQNIGKWNARITDQEAQIIEFWLNDVMKYWDYDFNFPLIDSKKVFSEFYNWYNSRYFYRDSFQISPNKET